MLINDINKVAEEKMQANLDAFNKSLGSLRTGRANPDILDNVMVDYYGKPTKLKQVASIVVESSTSLLVKPFEKQMVGAVERAIIGSSLGLNPAASGVEVRVPIPPLTQERRNALVKQLKEFTEKAKVALRETRREANIQIKKLLDEKIITEDVARKAETSIQKLTDNFSQKVIDVAKKKEQDLTTL